MPSSSYRELPRERILSALDGDRAAFAELYGCYSATVRSSVATAIRFRDDLAIHLDDIVGEIWTRFLADDCKRLRSYDPDRGVFGYYLRMRTHAMARMLAAQYVRRAKTVELDDPFLSLFGEEQLEGRVLHRDVLVRLYAAVKERLSEVDLALFDNVYVKGRKIADVAGELDLSKDAAYRRSHRLKDKIQRIADELFGTDTHAGSGGAIVGLLVIFAAQLGIRPPDVRMQHAGAIEADHDAVAQHGR